jgi:hypothetical protein
MSLPWIKISSRAAVLIIVYLLLSIPDTKYQYFNGETVTETPYSSVTDELITIHLSSIIILSEKEKSRQYDSLITILTTKLITLRSELLERDNPIIDSMTNDFGLASAIISLSSNNPIPLLESLWNWRQYLKEQSLFWNVNNNDQKLHIASTMSFVGLCEDFIVMNRGLVYTKLSNTPASLNPALTLSIIKSGDFILSSDDISYCYLEQAKVIPELTPSLGLILIKGDSSFYISSTPTEGLHIVKTSDFIRRPMAKVLQLRLRDELPELISNPAIPHQTASFVYDLAIKDNIDYEFTFNPLSRNSFCETGLLRFAYEDHNINFITSYSPVNNAYVYGLNRLGIRNENRATASELQFHHSIEVVGQHLSGEGIKTRNLEMASSIASLTTIDAKLMKSLRWRLPYYRLLKGYSSIISLIGKNPVIPNGMAPEAAMIHDYISTQNEELLPLLINEAAQFERENQYFPTYKMLCEMAMTNLATQ